MVTTRRATPTDLSRLMELRDERQTLLHQVDTRFALQTIVSEVWTRWLTDERCAIYVADHDAVLIGYAIGWLWLDMPGLPPQSGVITELILDAHTYQGGTGRLLLSALRDWFAQQGIQHIIAAVPHRHAVEQAFWRAAGAAEFLDWMWLP